MYTPLPARTNKVLAIILIAAGWLLLPDIFTLGTTPGSDMLNVFIAGALSDMTWMSYHAALMSSFGFAFLLMLAGFLIYPYNTGRLLRGKARNVLALLAAHPALALIAVVSLALVWIYGNMFYGLVKDYAMTLGGA